ncbi:MAG TPA: CHAP domain-containing protein [Candidatus Saccharimonadales bacterium]|nr:CHAP domain-containing protein [Candidatus Saccharimonadales bacterium]
MFDIKGPKKAAPGVDTTFAREQLQKVQQKVHVPEAVAKRSPGFLGFVRKLKSPAVLSNGLLFLVVVTILAFGYQPSQNGASQSGIVMAIENSSQTPTVDQVASVTAAANVATSANLLVVNNVKEVADTVAVKTALAQSQDTYVTKPQLVTQSLPLGVNKYIVRPGDSAATVAAAFGLTDQTIRWANDLTSDTLTPGQQIWVPAVNGVVYTVSSGDTAQSIADKFHSDPNQIIAENDDELTGVQAGQVIVVPNGVLPADEQPGASHSSSASVSASSGAGFSFGTGPVFGGDGYAFGYCTYWAALRRQQIGDPVPNNWGNASTWADGAEAMGLTVNHTPSYGAVMQTAGGYGGYGHVAFVESVNSDGSFTISEMNYAGWDVVDQRTLPASDAGLYNFIH